VTVRDRLILAVDVDRREEALALADLLTGSIGMLKVGLELLNATGPSIVREIRERSGLGVFYDGKFHDIPNTVAGAVRAAVRAGANMLNVHAAGGMEMMKAAGRAAAETAAELGINHPVVIAVTVLTSLDEAALRATGVPDSPSDQVLRLARLAQDAGLDGVVSSPQEIAGIRRECGPDFVIVTPGVRPADAGVDDQKRIATPEAALKAGADYLVIGRPIRAAADPVAAARQIVETCEQVVGRCLRKNASSNSSRKAGPCWRGTSN